VVLVVRGDVGKRLEQAAVRKSRLDDVKRNFWLKGGFFNSDNRDNFPYIARNPVGENMHRVLGKYFAMGQIKDGEFWHKSTMDDGGVSHWDAHNESLLGMDPAKQSFAQQK
jgi:hypothetical protein